MTKPQDSLSAELLEKLESIQKPENFTGTTLKTNMTIIGWFNGLPIYDLDYSESYLCMILSEATLTKDWNSEEEDEAWKNL